MDDRYLFRAKRTDNGEWVEGFYFCMEHTDKRHIHHFIIPLGASLEKGTPIKKIQVEVDPSTICQCTGLEDKNGVLIWENDICIIRDGTLDEEDGYFRLDWEIDRAMFEFEGPGLCVNFDNVYGYECEVVGNIFDNPELLE